MRKLQYKTYPGVGQGATKVEGTLKDLFLHLDAFWASELIPPLFILNEVLQEGVYDAGMSGALKWTPFAITQKEYEELTEDLVTTPAQSYKAVEVPEWVKSKEDWSDWIYDYLSGMPVEEARALEHEFQVIFAARAEARAQGDTKLEAELLVKLNEAGRKQSEFLGQYLLKGN